MAANAELSQLVGDVCKGCLTNSHSWTKGRIETFRCDNTKSCAPNSPEDLKLKAGTNKVCPLYRR